MQDLHVHSPYSDGRSSIEDLLEVAEEKRLRVIAITDHGPGHVCGMSRRDVQRRRLKVEELSESYNTEVVLGVEVDVDLNGNFRVPEEVDFILASMHGQVRHDQYFRAMMRAVEDPRVDVIAHHGFALNGTPDHSLDEKLVEKMGEYGVAVEVNAGHQLPDHEFLRLCAEAGVKYTLGSDGHDARAIGRVGWSKRTAELFFEEDSLLWPP